MTIDPPIFLPGSVEIGGGEGKGSCTKGDGGGARVENVVVEGKGDCRWVGEGVVIRQGNVLCKDDK